MRSGAAGVSMASRTVYVTQDGLQILQEERRYLAEVRRGEIHALLRTANELADIMDNPEYAAGKREQEQVERRIVELDRMLANATVITEAPARAYVTLGSRVQVRAADGEVETYVIVGAVEADPRKGRVSNESPIGRALLGKRAGQRCSVVAPGGSFVLELVSIE